MTTVDLTDRVLSDLGIPLQPQSGQPGIELRLALEQDDLFGSVIVFSYGAMAMDVWDDVTYRVAPLTARDPHRMVLEPLAAKRLLQGYHDAPAPNLAAIEGAIAELSAYAAAHPEYTEIVLDPLIARPDGLYAKAARVTTSGRA